MTTITTAPARLLEGLNEAQREAVSITSGPLAIIAGAGSGKTRVISHRAAYAVETGVVAADRVLLVTFTEKAAAEMVERLAALGQPGVAARTFHAAALAQLRHFWPSRHDGAPAPGILDSKARLLAPLARRLPGGYAFTTVKDLAEAIEWAKVRRIPPERWIAEGGDRAPIPAELFARLYAGYERAKARADVIDFEDMLVETVRLLEADPDAAAVVRARKTWFSVDEYQDTNPLAERLLELWLGGSRDLAVVGDPDQTIYSFTGATPEFLLRFEARHPGARVVPLTQNYRSSPEILALANRLVGPGPRGALVATRPPGASPSIRRYPTADAELAAIVEGIGRLIRGGTDPGEIAVLVRINAQLPELEGALTRAAIPFRVRGQRFFERPEVRDARRLLARARLAETGPALAAAIRALFAERLGLDLDDEDRGRASRGSEAAERAASLQLLVELAEDAAGANAHLALADVVAELDRRDVAEASSATAGVNLLTYHRAKGLEWDAVFLPALEEGLVPIRQAKDDAAIAEERRLLYVGITRARRHLALSWAARRSGSAGKEGARKPSRFLDALERASSSLRRRPTVHTGGGLPPRIRALERDSDGTTDADADWTASRGLVEALQAWRRERARRDGTPAYVVAHDATLAEIAAARPRSPTALQGVKGMGPAKVDRYGAEILAIVGRDVGRSHP
jgi:DNA helicase-2/ATP-dependent DNA helicase PcrA